MRIGVAIEAVRPRLAVHADTGARTARIAEVAVQSQATCLRIKIHHEQTVISVFARVQNDSATVRSAAIQCGFCFSSRVTRETSRT